MGSVVLESWPVSLLLAVGLVGPLVATWLAPPRVGEWVGSTTGWTGERVLADIRLLLVGVVLGTVLAVLLFGVSADLAVLAILIQHGVVATFTDTWFRRVDRTMGWVHVATMAGVASVQVWAVPAMAAYPGAWLTLIGVVGVVTIVGALNLFGTAFPSSDIRVAALLLFACIAVQAWWLVGWYLLATMGVTLVVGSVMSVRMMRRGDGHGAGMYGWWTQMRTITLPAVPLLIWPFVGLCGARLVGLL